MPSTNKLFSHPSLGNHASKRHLFQSHLGQSIAKFLLSFCGIASFGVVTMAIPTSATSATGSTSNNVSVGISSSVAIRLLDSTATFDITRLDFDLTPTASGVSTTKRTVVDVATSNPTGYKLYMQSNYQDHSGNYTTNLVHSYTDVSDTIPTSINSGDKVYWNYVNPLTSTTNTIPAHGHPDKIGQYFSPTNSNQTPLDVNVSVDTSIVAGTYENQLLFSAVGNPTTIAYKLDFNTGSGTMVGEDIVETAAAWTHSITIPGNPSTNSYTDYIPTGVNTLFTGWTISIPADSSTTASCNGSSICHPGDTINITGGLNQSGDMVGEVTLTANYVSISTMQAMTPTICNTATIGASTTLTDTRDNKTYTIRKLKDGNCWMTQNLRLSGPKTLTSANTSLALDFNLTASDDGTWCAAKTAECYNQSMVLDSGDDNYGFYYNWYAATAGSGTYELTSGNATSSICPKGWRLPTGGEGGELRVLANYYPVEDSRNQMISGEPSLALSGVRNSSNIDNQGSVGYYWSSTPYDEGNAYNITLNNSATNPAGSLLKYRGFTLRCLAHDNSYSILGVDPNGGTWNNKNTPQTFAKAPNSTQIISNPTVNATYKIEYDMGSTGIATPSSPTSASRPFTGWTASLGEGATFVPASGLYTYGTGNSSLVAQYSSTSSSFNLPTLSKSGYTCKWAEGSASGTQYAGGTSRTITGDTTYYAVCEIDAPTSCATATPVTPGQAAGTQNMYTSGGIQYVKLYTNSALTTSACYTKESQGTATSVDASSKCPSGTGLPNATSGSGEFGQLVSAYGSGGNLYTATGWSGYYWSSTSYIANYYYYALRVNSSSAYVDYYGWGRSNDVVCIVR